MAARATPGIHIEFRHVRGHSNDPWNDLADHVAKTAANQTCEWPRDEFLATLGPLLQRLKHTNLLLGGIDLNGRPPPAYEGVTGNLEYGEPDTTGWSAVQILADAGVWIPSTYSQLHCGESATYVHPSGQQHRIDYLLVGGRARVHFVRSETDETFDNGSPQEDHTLLCADLTGSTVAPHGQRKLLRPVYDRDKLLSSEGRALVRDVIAAFPHPAWGTHPDQHCVQIETYLRKALDTHFAQPQKAKRASYIPDCVWKRRDAKMQFKRRVRHRMHLWHDLLCRAFYGWQTCQDYGVGLLLGKQSLLYELASAAIRFVTAEIKKSISKAKNAFLFQLAGENSQGAATIMQKAKKAGVGGSKTRPVSRPLPVLLHPENGSAAASRDQRDAVWLLHFGKQEQGQIVSTADFIRGAESSCYEPNVVWTAAMLPTYGDIEKVLRDVQHNKAMGLDNIPGEILKAAPAETARLLFPLFIKSMRFGLDAEDVDDLMQTVEAGGMLAQAGVVKDLHLHTWFVSRFADGTRDLTFTVLYDQAAGIFPPVSGTEDLAVTDTTWADDSAFPLEDVDASVLMRKTVRLCTLVLSFCTSHGMAPNLKPGKTSVMIALAGKGSRQARRDYFPGGTQRLWLPDLQVGVAVTDQYKHLGGVVDCKLTMKPEVRFRLAQAASSYDADLQWLVSPEEPQWPKVIEPACDTDFWTEGHIPPTPVTPSWSAEQTSVYRATCDLLFALQGTETYEMLLLAINTVLQQSPLYPDEIDAILDTLIAEVQEVTADDTDAPWSVLQVRAILTALADLRSGLWTDTKEHVDRRLYHSLREFHQLLTGFDWAASLKTFAKGDVTPSILEYSVPPDWKAEWQRNCSRIEVSAVARDL
ncbi:rbcL, partial [Symbiodinium sp. KB8]